jgi:magnesium-transporting ATPase (P-type)
VTIGLAFRDETDESTFPLSPVAALLINTIAAGPPAMALGYEPTDKHAMDNRPSDYDTIFTFWWYMDLFYYGFMMCVAFAFFPRPDSRTGLPSAWPTSLSRSTCTTMGSWALNAIPATTQLATSCSRGEGHALRSSRSSS